MSAPRFLYSKCNECGDKQKTAVGSKLCFEGTCEKCGEKDMSINFPAAPTWWTPEDESNYKLLAAGSKK